jgi:hypothetical protein
LERRWLVSRSSGPALFVPLSILSALTVGNAIAGDPIDPVTGDRPVASRPVTPLPARGNTNVLWDTTHGICSGYEPRDQYSALAGSLPHFSFIPSNAGIDNIDLSPYDILVICAGSACQTAYGPSEVAAAQAFAAGGGSVLIMGDIPNSGSSNINPVAAALGAEVGVSFLHPPVLYFSNFASHPIFWGVSEIRYDSGGALDVSGPAMPVAWTNDGLDVTVALSESPRVVILGDINVFATSGIQIPDNLQFASNLFWYLANYSPTGADAVTWGRIKTQYRR